MAMSEVFATIRLKPSEKPKFGDYELDYVALECDRDGRVTDFRLELGRGLSYAWAVPVEPNGRLRLIFTGIVTIDDMEPELLVDPYSVEHSESWDGELGNIGQHILTHVQLHMTHEGYRVDCRVRLANGSIENYLLSYQQA
jgi:hypothetical protein